MATETLEAPPDSYEHTGEDWLTNFDFSVDPDADRRLRSEEILCYYTAWDFCGTVWWCRKTEKFKCAVMCRKSHVDTIVAGTLEELMALCSAKHGAD